MGNPSSDALALAKKQRRSKPRIILVNDDSNALQLMELLILNWFDGATILTFQSGEEARQELEREDPDLLITDLGRENDPMDGWAMIPLLVEKRVKYPIIVASGYGEYAAKHYDETGNEAISVTFRDLLQQARLTLNIKAVALPFENEELLKVLEARLEIRGTPRCLPSETPSTEVRALL